MVGYGDKRVEACLRKAEVADGERRNVRGVVATDVNAMRTHARVLGDGESARGATVGIGDGLVLGQGLFVGMKFNVQFDAGQCLYRIGQNRNPAHLLTGTIGGQVGGDGQGLGAFAVTAFGAYVYSFVAIYYACGCSVANCPVYGTRHFYRSAGVGAARRGVTLLFVAGIYEYFKSLDRFARGGFEHSDECPCVIGSDNGHIPYNLKETVIVDFFVFNGNGEGVLAYGQLHGHAVCDIYRGVGGVEIECQRLDG